MLRLLIITTLLIPNAAAQWSTDPAANLLVGYGLLPEICSDGAGGAYISYENNLGYPRQIVVQRLNKPGIQAWTSPVMIRGIWPESRYAVLCSNNAGDLLVAFEDRVELSPMPQIEASRCRVQRIDRNGNCLWGSSGVRVTDSEASQIIGAMESDGSGGCIVAWIDSMAQLRIQRLDSLGTRTWGDSGLFIASGIYGSNFTPKLQRVSGERFMIGYSSSNLASVSHVQKFDMQGERAWETPVRLEFLIMDMAPDGHGGIICSGRVAGYDTATIAAQRIDSTGAMQWSSPFLILASGATINNAGVPIAIDEEGKSAFCWVTMTGGINSLFMQRVSLYGTPTWGPGGIRVSTVQSSQWLPLSIASVNHRTIVSWADGRTPPGQYAQALDASGGHIWDSADVKLTVRPYSEVRFRGTTDGTGGIIAVWYEEPSFAVLAQQISRNGNLGEVIPSAVIAREEETPETFDLLQNYPNPFNPSTTIRYQLPSRTHVTLTVFDLLGREVATLVEGMQAPGEKMATFDGSTLASGVYFYQIRAGGFVETRKLLLIR